MVAGNKHKVSPDRFIYVAVCESVYWETNNFKIFYIFLSVFIPNFIYLRKEDFTEMDGDIAFLTK